MKKILIALIVVISLISACNSSDNGNDNGTETCIANFTASPISGSISLEVQFTDQSTGDINSWEWDFGDGNTSTEQNPSHIYDDSGKYTVTLKVSRLACTDTETKVGYITVETTSPTLLPDLVIVSGTRTPSDEYVAPNTTVQFELTVRNIGQADCYQDFSVGGGSAMGMEPGIGELTGGLLVNEEKTVTLECIFYSAASTFSNGFTVDIYNSVKESNEDNNDSMQFIVKTTN